MSWLGAVSWGSVIVIRSRMTRSHAKEADAELVLNEFARGADATVSQVVDVVRPAAAVVEANDLAGDGEQVFRSQHAILNGGGPLQPLVDLVAAHLAQVVATGVEEEGVNQAAGVLHCGRVAGAEPAVELQQGFLFVLVGGVSLQGGLDVVVVGVGVRLLEEGEDAIVAAQQLGKLVAQAIGLPLRLGALDLLLDLGAWRRCWGGPGEGGAHRWRAGGW